MANYKILNPSQAIMKTYLKNKVSREEIRIFRDAMDNLLKGINPEESEEHNKDLVAEFLNKSLYRNNQYKVNTYNKTDLAIFTNSNTSFQHPVVLFEFKGPSRPDMVSKDSLIQKSMCELVLYYIREVVEKNNTDIQNLIISDCTKYFIFDSSLFYRLFIKCKSFANKVIEADRTHKETSFIYDSIIRPRLVEIEDRLSFTYIDLAKFKNVLKNDDIFNTKTFVSAYKLFSPTHLLKLPYSFDHNHLNKQFYQELLYIMGLEEVTDDKSRKIVRLRTGRQQFSLLEQVYSRLEDWNIYDDKIKFDTALGLIIAWINRLLFLKLLEAQLLNFNPQNKDVRFLNKKSIKDLDILNDLFLKVLAKPYAMREQAFQEAFPNVPYLNSSLFELTELEKKYFPISGIRNGNMKVFSSTVLKNSSGRKIQGDMDSLDYLFKFLDSIILPLF